MNLIERLKTELKLLKVSQVELTKLAYGGSNIKTNQSTISRILGGSLACTLDKIMELIRCVGAEPYVIVKSSLKSNFKRVFDYLPENTRQEVMNEIEKAHRLFKERTASEKEIDIECILWINNYINNHIELISTGSKLILIIEKKKERNFLLN